VRILVVEDDENTRDCIAGVLSIYNFEVINAGSAEEALQNFEPRAGDIHILLTDLILPKMNGSELAQHFLAKNPEIKVLYMTGYDDETHRLEALPGKAALLRKPFSLNQVLTTVQSALEGR
jgi:DNA-binding NtrC family response regulator